MKKLLSVFLALVMLLSLLGVGVAVSAATPTAQVLEAVAGETIKIKFSEDDCYGVSGWIRYSNRNLFSSLTPGGTTQYGPITEDSFILSSFDKADYEVVLTVKIADNAKVGDQCVVEFYGCERADNNVDFTGPSDYTKSVTVKVVKKEAATTTATKKPTTTTTAKPTTTTKPVAPTTTTKPVTPTTTKPVINLDLTELNKQIGIAEALNEGEYTADSWARLASALKVARNARKATTQSAVNKAADALKEAIAALVKIDGNALEQLMDEIKGFLEENDLTSVWEELRNALDDADDALKSGDQDAIDDAYTRLDAAFKALKAKLDELSKPQFVDKEVYVEVPPEGPYCNIWLHKLWPILLIISALLNVVFVVLTVMYFVKRKKNTVDNTPVVDYDINDD